MENSDDNPLTKEVKLLLEKKELTLEDIKRLEEISRVILKESATVGKKESALDIIKKYHRTCQKLGEALLRLSQVIPNQRQQQIERAATVYVIAAHHIFNELHKHGIVSNLSEKALESAICEDESPYYLVKSLLGDAQRIYDDLAVNYASQNLYVRASNAYFILGNLFVSEIDYAKKIQDKVLYGERNSAYLYYNAGRAFLRSHHLLEERYLTVYHGAPALGDLSLAISSVFKTGNFMPSRLELAESCFTEANRLFRITGNRRFYMKTRDLLYSLRSEKNDFQQNISRIFVEISRNLEKVKAPFLEIITKVKQVKETHIRNYYMSHINLMINDIAVAESMKPRGFSDLSIFGRDYHDRILEAIAEFKIWGRGSKEHSYKKVLPQLRKYLSDFENFGLIVMINPNKNGIREKYIKEVILADKLYVKDSLEDEHQESSFTHLRSQHYTLDSKGSKVAVHHFILNMNTIVQLKK